MEGHLDIAQYLIAQGADVNAKDNVRYDYMLMQYTINKWMTMI